MRIPSGCECSGIIDDTAGFNDLQIVHGAYKENKHQGEEQQQNRCPESAYSFHAVPPIVQMVFAMG